MVYLWHKTGWHLWDTASGAICSGINWKLIKHGGDGAPDKGTGKTRCLSQGDRVWKEGSRDLGVYGRGVESIGNLVFLDRPGEMTASKDRRDKGRGAKTGVAEFSWDCLAGQLGDQRHRGNPGGGEWMVGVSGAMAN
jgi:hypothetical protein